MRFLFISDQHADIDLASGLITKIEIMISGHQILRYTAEDLEMENCVGCFGCWIKTPGECIHKDSGAALCRDYIACDQVILLSPVLFGCYSPAIKRVFERISPVNLPFIRQSHGKSHHAPRYKCYPAITVVGYGKDVTLQEEKTLTSLVRRTAVNFHKTQAKTAVCRSLEEADEALGSLGLVLRPEQGGVV